MPADSIQLTLHGLSKHITCMDWDGTNAPVIRLNNGQSYTVTVPGQTQENLRFMDREKWIDVARKVDEVLTKVGIWEEQSYAPANDKIYDLTIDHTGVDWNGVKKEHQAAQKETFSAMLKIVTDSLQIAANSPPPPSAYQTELAAQAAALAPKMRKFISTTIKDSVERTTQRHENIAVKFNALDANWINLISAELRKNTDVKDLRTDLLQHVIHQEIRTCVEDVLKQILCKGVPNALKKTQDEAASVAEVMQTLNNVWLASVTPPVINAHLTEILKNEVWVTGVIHAEYEKARFPTLSERVTKFFGSFMKGGLPALPTPSLNFAFPSFSAIPWFQGLLNGRVNSVWQFIKGWL